MKPEQKTGILQLFRWNSCNETPQRNTFLGKTIFSVRQKGVLPLLLPTSVLQLPRCLVRICNLFLINHKIANLIVSKNAIAAGKSDCKIEFASQMWAARPHLANIFKKLLDQKTFYSACGSHLIAASEKIKNRIDKSTKVAYNNKERQPFGCYKEKTEQ